MGGILRGPSVLAGWAAATLTAPLVWFHLTHRGEEHPGAPVIERWVIAALLCTGVVMGARTAGRARAVRVSTVAGAGLLAVTLAYYRWVVVLPGSYGWRAALWPAAATVGGLLGHVLRSRTASVLGSGGSDSSGLGSPGLSSRGFGSRGFGSRGFGSPGAARPAGGRYVAGLLVALLGASLAPWTVRLGAEGSTVAYDEGSYGAVGDDPNFPPARTLPAAGEYAIYAVGFDGGPPDCRVDGVATTPLTVPPGDYGSDWATYTWVATFSVPAPGDHTFTCNAEPAGGTFVVGAVPRIRGAVSSLIHWPKWTLWLLGALPGLIVAADILRNRRQPVPAAQPPGTLAAHSADV